MVTFKQKYIEDPVPYTGKGRLEALEERLERLEEQLSGSVKKGGK